jgi:ferredoxin
MARRLRVDPIACEANGSCHELLPELIGVDRWGYPVVDGSNVPEGLLNEARRAVDLCPRAALALERVREGPAGKPPAAGAPEIGIQGFPRKGLVHPPGGSP